MTLTKTLNHPVASAAGWFSVFIAALIPLSASVVAAHQLHQGRCTTYLQWTFAPLVAACDPSQDLQVWGWVATIAIFVAFAVALGIGLAKLFLVLRRGAPSKSRSDTFHAIDSWSLVGAVSAVPMAVWLVLVADPDELWGRNSWIFFAGIACLLVLVCARCLRSILLLRARQHIS